MQIVVLFQRHHPDTTEQTSLHEQLKVAVSGTPGTKFWRQGFPLAARPQDIKNAVEHWPPIQPRPTTFLRLPEFR
jgi:hypothetical protein